MANCNYFSIPEGPLDEGYFCTVRYTGDGLETDYIFEFPYINQSSWDGETSAYIRCYINGVETLDFTMPTNASVSFGSAPADNACIKILRDSDLSDRKVNYQSGSRHTADVENLESLNTFYLIQELCDRLRDGSLVWSEDGMFNAYRWTTLADGNETSFPMSTSYGPNDESGLSNEAEVLVMVNGAGQHTTEYTLTDIGGITNVVFDTAPPDGAIVEARTMSSGIVQTLQVNNGTITGAKLGDCCIDSATWLRAVCIDDLASNDKDVFIWDDTSGGLVLSIRGLTAADISDFDSAVQDIPVNTLAAPTGALNMSSEKITNLADGTADQDAVSKLQMETYVAAEIAGSSAAGQLSNGAYMSFSSTAYTQVDVGFDWDMLVMYVNVNNGEVGCDSGNGVTGVGNGGSGYNSSKFHPSAIFVRYATEGSGEQRYQYRQGDQFTLNYSEFTFQKITDGFQVKRSGTVSETIEIRWFAITFNTGA